MLYFEPENNPSASIQMMSTIVDGRRQHHKETQRAEVCTDPPLPSNPPPTVPIHHYCLLIVEKDQLIPGKTFENAKYVASIYGVG